jgi:DHA2 family multidrug resistance protein
MIGMLLSVVMSAVNLYSTDINAADIQGNMLFGADEQAWSKGIFEAAMVIGMTFAPWCAVTFTLRRMALFMTGLMAFAGLLCPFAPNLAIFYVLRGIQGLAGGAVTPLLITVALRYCPPRYRLYGFAAYALSSNFGPNMSLPIAGWSSDYFGLSGIFWNIVPFCVLSMAAVAYGLPKDPWRFDRFKRFDIVGVITGAVALAMLAIAATQGNRLNWFDSPLFTLLFFGGGFLLAFFLLNEWFHPAPIFKLQILARPNFLFAVIGILVLVIVFLGVVVVPLEFLAETHGYRPGDSGNLALVIALPQLVILPAISALLNVERIDCRWVFITGLILTGTSCYLASTLNAEWIRDDFYWLAALLSVGEAMAILPLLMLVVDQMPPDDGPYVSALFNSTKGFASILIGTIIEGFGRWRIGYHSSVLVSQLGRRPDAYHERLSLLGSQLTGAVSDPGARADVALGMLAEHVHLQSVTLAMADLYRLLVTIVVGMVVVTLTIPTRMILQANRSKAVASLKRMEALRDQARLNLSYTVIRAPIDGFVGRRSVRPGAYVDVGSALLAIVPTAQSYVVANYQESQIGTMRLHQPAKIRIDSFPGLELRGHVDSIAPATDLAFAPIQPDNATGNFTKIVQRIPVKIVLDPNQESAKFLRVGMSVVPTVDVRAPGGAPIGTLPRVR